MPGLFTASSGFWYPSEKFHPALSTYLLFSCLKARSNHDVPKWGLRPTSSITFPMGRDCLRENASCLPEGVRVKSKLQSVAQANLHWQFLLKDNSHPDSSKDSTLSHSDSQHHVLPVSCMPASLWKILRSTKKKVTSKWTKVLLKEGQTYFKCTLKHNEQVIFKINRAKRL